MEKHLTQWRKRHLPFVIGEDRFPAAYITNWFNGNNEAPEWLPESYYSDTHKTTINVCECGKYLIEIEDCINHQEKEFLRFVPQLTSIAAVNATLWDTQSESI